MIPFEYMLRGRYDNKQLQISSHMQRLLNLNVVKDINNVKLLRVVYDNIEGQIRSLENLGIKADEEIFDIYLKGFYS